MSKYTTEVRYICERYSGLDNSVGGDNIDNVISNSWDKIFTTKTTFFDEAYRAILCKKILKHFYLREIGCETVGIWKLWMNTRLEEIMPYYNKLYESEKIKFNPMQDIDFKSEHNRTVDGKTTEDGKHTENSIESKNLIGEREVKNNGNRDTTTNGNNGSENSSTNNVTGTSNNENTSKDLYSDTPQGSISGLESMNYLTNARIINNKGNTSNSEDSNTSGKNTGTYDETNNEKHTDTTTTNYNEKTDTNNSVNGTSSNNGTSNTTETYVENVIGKQGTESYSSLLNKFRDTFLNIDMQVIEEFDDLFMELW